MKITYRGLALAYAHGKGNRVEITADIHKDNISIEQDEDTGGKFTDITVNGKSIVVDTDSLECKLA